jgi:hypothetical protein
MTVPAAATCLTPVSATADARGLAAASTAFVIWGVLPLYLKQHVPALQIMAHRLVWGCLFGMLLLGVRSELTRVHSAFADPRVRWRLCASAALVSVNWLTYVWAIGNHRVVESSLGYFINPLLRVVVLSEGLSAFRSTNARNNQVQIVKPLRIHLHERSREEISLFLIVSFKNNPVAAQDQGFESLDDLFLRQDRSPHPELD